MHHTTNVFVTQIYSMSKRFSTLKNPYREREIFNHRVIAVAVGITILATLLIARLVYLQIYQHKLYTTLAEQNQLGLVPIDPVRGLIYDRHGVLLVKNKPVFNLVVTPDRVTNMQATITELSKIIKIDADDLRQFYRQKKLHRRFEPVPLRLRLTEEEVAHFSVDKYHFPGVDVQAQMIRYYPLGDIFASVVGYVGRINEQELQNVDPSNYSATNFIGKTGVEKSYEDQLHGTVGYQQIETDVHGQTVRVLKRTPPIPGDNLYLTIDSGLQIAATQALGTQRGAIVAMDPRNGEILAFVSGPSFDPNLFVSGISKEAYQALQNADGNPLFNRALRGRYPPGSTVKPYLALEALLSNVITPSYTVYDPGWFQLNPNGRIYHNWHRMPHGTVDLHKAVVVSSDVFFYGLATKLGITRIDDILTRFGYGQATGVDLEDEPDGLVPTPEWKKKKYGEGWYPGDTLITGIGQGFLLVTPLQMASAVSTIAMKGHRWWPHVLFSNQGANGLVIRTQPKELSTMTVDNKLWDFIRSAMQDVVGTPDGTANRYFQNIHYTAAGKTGTAQVFSLKKDQVYNSNTVAAHLRDNSLFIVFAPADDPKIALAIVIQNSVTPAAQVAKQILDYYFGENKNPNLVIQQAANKEKKQQAMENNNTTTNSGDEEDTNNKHSSEEDSDNQYSAPSD